MFERKKQAGKIYFLPIDQIRPSPFQARREFSEQELAALAQSIRETVCCSPSRCGSCRMAATSWWQGSGGSVPAGWQKMTTIPAILCNYGDERTAARWACWKTSSGPT